VGQAPELARPDRFRRPRQRVALGRGRLSSPGASAPGSATATVQGFLDRWLRRLPSALTASDRRAGYGYRFSIRQLELSHTAVFDRPQSGRAWFEAAIREHLDLGRPEQVTLVVNRTIVNRDPAPRRGGFETPGVAD